MFRRFSNTIKLCYSDNKNIAYIPIPKNASQFGMKYFCEGYNLIDKQDWSDKDIKDKNFIIFLRDPVQRWLWGISEFIYQEKYNYNRPLNLEDDSILSLLFSGANFDAHTTPQMYFFEGLNLVNCYFFDIDDRNFTGKLNFFCHKMFGYKNINVDKKNVTIENTHKLEIFNKINFVFQNNKDLNELVHYKLTPDMDVYHHLQEANKFV